jgi:CRP/FNR family cyclic AMP-dependent transcriptional regulator
MPDVDMLRNVPLFAGLADQELLAVARSLGKRSFGKGVFIFHKDSPGQVLYIIESGRVRIFALSDLGQEISLNIYGPGDVFGELGALDGLPRSASVLAMEMTITLTLQRDDFLRCLEAYPQVARNFCKVLAARLRYTTAYVEGLAFLDVNGRVAAKLLELADYTELRLTQAELASWVAASRESVNKALCAFRERGLIEINGQKLTILDPRGLRRQISY